MKPEFVHLTDKNTVKLFSVPELAEMFGVSAPTAKKRIASIDPITTLKNIKFYDISEVAVFMDCRKSGGYVNQHGSYDPNKVVSDNPDEMTPAERNLHWKAEDLKQATKLKERKNMVEARMLIPAHEVELSLASAFKTIALTLDTLPDSLERDGIISSGDIETIISILDSSREQLANDLTDLSPITATIQEEYFNDR